MSWRKLWPRLASWRHQATKMNSLGLNTYVCSWQTIFSNAFIKNVSFNITPSFPIVRFHNYLSPSGEQPEQRILTHKSEQPPAGCIAIFHKYSCNIKHGGIITNLTLWNPWGILLISQSTTTRVYGARVRIYDVLCSKTYSTSYNLS